MRERLLVVDDDPTLRESLAMLLRKAGYSVRAVNDASFAMAALETESFDLVLSDLKMHDPRTGVLTEQAGHSLLREVKRLYPGTPVMLITGNQEIATAVEAIKAGALDYVTKPYRAKEIADKVARALSSDVNGHGSIPRNAASALPATALDTSSPAMRIVLDTALRVANRDTPVLISGPPGCGKELVARFVHAKSSRAAEPFLAASCGGIPEALFEDELFGHERGAFTGAARMRRGLFEQAAGGTVFLDCIEETPLALQGKLVLPVERREVKRVGATRPISCGARVLASTAADLRAWVAEGRFRPDLFFALHVVHLEVPPLCQRSEDIPALAFEFLREAARRQKRNLTFEPSAIAVLGRLTYPGNIRELRNLVLATATFVEGRIVKGEHLEQALERTQDHVQVATVRDTLEVVERERVRLAIARHPNNRSAAARELGISRTTLWRKLSQLGLEQSVE